MKALSNLLRYQIQTNCTLFTTEYAISLARTNITFCAGFFNAINTLKIFLLLLSKSHLAVHIWCGKRDKYFSPYNGKGV